MRTGIYFIFAFFIGFGFAACKKNMTGKFPEKPNFVFIIADDMAWNDCGAYGNAHIRTPNLDRLAEQGMKFNRAFLATSSCSPSRSSIITGMYPHKTDAEQLHWPLPASKTTFVEKLKAAGYWTAQAGKWHLGNAVKDRFDVVHDAGTEGYQLSVSGKQGSPKGDGSGCELWVSTLQERPQGKPFFLWLASFDPHRDYREGISNNPHSPENVIIPPYLPDNQATRKELALYYDEISRLDGYIGQVLEELRVQGVEENTIVFFISDNGRPFPRDKTTLYNGGIKAPWIIRWPEVIEPGSESNSLVSAVDIAPTILRLAGLEPLPDSDGIDFSGILLNPEEKTRNFIFAESNWHDYEDYSRALATERFKYIKNFYREMPDTPPADVVRSQTYRTMQQMRDSGSLAPEYSMSFVVPRPEEELYDLDQDPFELRNLARNPDYADVLKDLRNLLENIRSETNDQVPLAWTRDEFDRETGQPNSNRQRPRPSKAEMRRVE